MFPENSNEKFVGNAACSNHFIVKREQILVVRVENIFESGQKVSAFNWREIPRQPNEMTTFFFVKIFTRYNYWNLSRCKLNLDCNWSSIVNSSDIWSPTLFTKCNIFVDDNRMWLGQLIQPQQFRDDVL